METKLAFASMFPGATPSMTATAGCRPACASSGEKRTATMNGPGVNWPSVSRSELKALVTAEGLPSGSLGASGGGGRVFLIRLEIWLKGPAKNCRTSGSLNICARDVLEKSFDH